MKCTIITEQGHARVSGWGFEYVDLTGDWILQYYEALRKK